MEVNNGQFVFFTSLLFVTAASSVHPVTREEYFDPDVDLGRREIGHKKREIYEKVQRFRALLWLCEDYPLQLPEQILPIVDLMAISSAHFAKLKEFIQLQLPAGFPVKIGMPKIEIENSQLGLLIRDLKISEIPLFHILNARITFGNIFGLDSSVPGVSCLEEDNRKSCYVDDSVFDAPPSYQRRGTFPNIFEYILVFKK